MSGPRVLLVEDDAAIRRLVEMVLEDEALDLLLCADAEAALELLAREPVAVLITDLMMPGLSGVGLLERLRDQPSLRRDARLVVFSAGLTPELREQLQALGVESFLDKPVSVQALVDELRRLLAGGAGASPAAAEGWELASEEAVIQQGFGGDRALFEAFRTGCVAQWPQDLLNGDAALAAADRSGLHRVAHTLKGSLQLLGASQLAAQALALERACAGDVRLEALGPAWQELARALRLHAEKLRG